MRSSFLRALLVCAALIPTIMLGNTGPLGAASPTIVISQVYGGGGNTGTPAATLKNDFIELFNRGSVPVNVTGWTVQYASTTGTSWGTTTLSGTIAPGAYYLVQEGQGSAGTVDLPPPNAIGTLALSATGGKVALVSNSTALSGAGGSIDGLTAATGTLQCPTTNVGAVVDFVGWGTGATCFETASAPATNNQTAVFRKLNGNQDTDNNAADFVAATAAPRNGASSTNPAGSLNASPSTVTAGDPTTFTVSVTPGTNPDSTNLAVKANLTSIGGSATQSFDPAGANQFTFTATVSSATTPGGKAITATITDGEGRTGTATMTLQVLSPLPSNPTGTGSASPSSVAPGGTTLLTVNVTPGQNPPSTGLAVTGDLSAIGGSNAEVFQSNGSNQFTFPAPIAQTTTPGAKTLPITIVDAEGRTSGLNITLTVVALADSTVVISQVYGGGGNSNATYQNDFVELYNRGTTTVDLAGWSLQYASATGSNWDNRQPLGGPIGPGEHYLVSLAANPPVGAELPAANIYGEINMSATTGKIALVDNGDLLAGTCPVGNAHVRDFVGYGGSANCREGTANAPAPSNTTSIIRLAGGFIDTNQNGSDFATGAPTPTRTAPITEIGPAVLSTDPRTNGVNAPRDATIQVTFTEAVDVSGAWFSLTCATSGDHSDATQAGSGKDRYITPNVNFVPGEKCTVTVVASQVADHDTDDSAPNTDTLPADYTWSFTVATGAAPPFPASVHLTFGNPTHATVTDPNNYLMEKPEYALSYNRDMGRPNWASWHLSEEWVGNLSRTDTFRADPAVPPDWYRVQSFDFFASGFDRGHMVPNADRDNAASIPINQATFLMSNMVAQAPDNNQGPWASFENYLRGLLPAVPEFNQPANEIYIVAGPGGAGGAGSNGLATTIANGHVTVPEYTWKVALVLPAANTDDLSRVSCTTKTIAVVMPNTQGIRNNDWLAYLTSVRAVEDLTHYNFFSNLPKPIQDCVEKGINGDNPELVKGDQAITIDAPDSATYGDGTFTVSGTGGDSGNPVTFAASGACTSSGTNGATITIISAGACVITASQAGSDLYNAAPDATKTVTVNRAAAAFSGLSAPTIEAGTSTVAISGNLAYGTLIPTGSVAVSVGASTVNATIGATGQFSATLPASALTVANSPYAIGFAYAGDANFIAATASSTLTVIDTVAPAIGTVTTTPGDLGAVNHKMFDVTVDYTVADSSNATCSLSVSSNEPVNGLADGNTSLDWQVVDPHHVQLRAERSGLDSGRLYTITISCTDASGNTSTSFGTVSVQK